MARKILTPGHAHDGGGNTLKKAFDDANDNFTEVYAALEEIDADIGDITPVTPVVRTNNPVLAENSSTANIDVLDAAIGADNTPVTRTNNPTVVNTTLLEKVQALDNAIGGNLTPVVRTNNPTVSNTTAIQKIAALDAAIGVDTSPCGARTAGAITAAGTVNANIDALDAAIGFEAQMSGTGKVVSKTATVFQNLDALDTYKTVETVKKTIGNIGVTANFNFVTGDNTTEQCIDLGAIIPAKARLLDIFVFTDAAFTNLGALTTDVGLTTGTDALIVAANNTALNAIMQPAVGAAFTLIAISATAQHVWINVAPTEKWNSATPVGKMSVYVTYINIANL
jgi:hypothetical protein